MDSIFKRRRGLPPRCWSCWWREGRLCYSTAEALGGELDQVPYKRPDGSEADFLTNKGREVTDDHFTACVGAGALKNKRELLTSLFGDIPLVIASEQGGA